MYVSRGEVVAWAMEKESTTLPPPRHLCHVTAGSQNSDCAGMVPASPCTPYTGACAGGVCETTNADATELCTDVNGVLSTCDGVGHCKTGENPRHCHGASLQGLRPPAVSVFRVVA